jgi:hypothetical protein
MARIARKTKILTCRLAPEVKDHLARVAEDERRSLAGMLEVMILDWCARHDAKATDLSATKAKQ